MFYDRALYRQSRLYLFVLRNGSFNGQLLAHPAIHNLTTNLLAYSFMKNETKAILRPSKNRTPFGICINKCQALSGPYLTGKCN